MFEESLYIWRELGSQADVAWVSHMLGYIALYQYDREQTATYLRESLRLYQEQNELAGLATCMAGLAEIASSANSSSRSPSDTWPPRGGSGRGTISVLPQPQRTGLPARLSLTL